MTRGALLRKLHALHRWGGVLLSANLLLLCVTGLVLLFQHEIDELLGDAAPPRDTTAAPLSLAAVFDAARRVEPTREPLMVGWDKEHPGEIMLLMRAPSVVERGVIITLDAASGERVGAADLRETFTGKVLSLHRELWLGTPGRLYIGLVGCVFVLLLVVGLVLYGPFMKQLAFGAVRGGRLSLAGADVHKALGVATAGWNVVVAATGALLTVGGQLVLLYLNTELAELRAPPSGEPPPPAVISLEQAVARANAVAPENMRLQRVALPGHVFAGDEDYMFLFEGTEGVAERLLSVVLVDTTSGEAVARELPWYLKALLLAEPLHFGDYGGLPLRLLWALFTLVTIALNLSGLVVFVARRRGRATS